MEFIVYGLIFAGGWYARQGFAVYKINKLMRTAQEEVAKMASDYTMVKIEKHNDLLYVFDSETDMFYAQGATVQEIVEKLKKHYPDKSFKALADNAKEVGIEQ